MDNPDVIVIGGGISGLAFAWKAARANRRVLLLEREPRVGGCVHSHRRPDDGHWFEIGAHTVYNSYGGLIDIALGSGLRGALVQRGAARARFGLLRDGRYTWLTPPRVLLQLGWLEAALHFPRGILRRREGRSVAEYYSQLIGPENFARVLSPFFAAVPSQSADRFPVAGAGSLFKKRPRRKDLPRSFGFDGGLQSVCDAAARTAGITIEAGVSASTIGREAAGFVVHTASGESLRAPTVALATPVDVAASVLRDGFGALAAVLARVETVTVESFGVVLPRERCWMPGCAFVVAADDLFFSAVTRDPFPDPRRRAFAFHFRPGVSREAKIERVSQVLRVSPSELGDPIECRNTLPAPAVGHDQIVRALDRELAGGMLALTGNYFDGLAIEDCVQRSFAEWERVAAR